MIGEHDILGGYIVFEKKQIVKQIKKETKSHKLIYMYSKMYT